MPLLLSGALHMLGRGELWDKIAGDLVVSVDKLAKLGFKWLTNTQDALRALGASHVAAAFDNVAERAPLKSRASTLN